jgi:cell division septum initiation protein DivIVA
MTPSHARPNSRGSLKDCLKGLYTMMLPDEERSIDAPDALGSGVGAELPGDTAGEIQSQALHVLTLAQRTAEEHLADAQDHADKIQEDARAAAEQILRGAQAQADAVRREAEQVLSDATRRAAEVAKEAKAHLDTTRNAADELVADTRARAMGMGKDAQAHAEKLAGQAQVRYEETVGRLAARREALQQQIEALQDFDRDYRSHLLAFIQAHVRALWTEMPSVGPDIEQPTDARSITVAVTPE